MQEDENNGWSKASMAYEEQTVGKGREFLREIEMLFIENEYAIIISN